MTALAVGGRGKGEQLAVIDGEGGMVTVFSRTRSNRFEDKYAVLRKDIACMTGVHVRLNSAVFNARGDLMICDTATPSICMFDSHGAPLKEVKLLMNYNGDIFICSVSLLPHGDIVVCDPELSCVHIFSSEEDKSHKIVMQHEDCADLWGR